MSENIEKLKKYYQDNYISKKQIRELLKQTEHVYEEQIKTYECEYGLNITGLTKKERDELINMRNCFLVQIETYKQLLEL